MGQKPFWSSYTCIYVFDCQGMTWYYWRKTMEVDNKSIAISYRTCNPLVIPYWAIALSCKIKSPLPWSFWVTNWSNCIIVVICQLFSDPSTFVRWLFDFDMAHPSQEHEMWWYGQDSLEYFVMTDDEKIDRGKKKLSMLFWGNKKSCKKEQYARFRQ